MKNLETKISNNKTPEASSVELQKNGERLSSSIEVLEQDQQALKGDRRFLKLQDRINKILRKTRDAVIATTMLGMLALEPNDPRERFEVKVGTDMGTHEKEYRHSDPETTAILNFIAGKEDFSSELKLKFATECILKNIEHEGIKIDAPDEITNPEAIQANLLKSLSALNTKNEVVIYYIEVLQKPDWIKTLQPREFVKGDRNLYEGLWKIEQMAGNPKLAWLYAATEKLPRTCYVRGEHTIYISSYAEGHAKNELVGEFAHAKMASDRPVSHFVRSKLEKHHVETVATSTGQDFWKTYGNSYDQPGSIEYEAHREIEPVLWKFLDSYQSGQK